MKFSYKKNPPTQITLLILGILISFILIVVIEAKDTYKKVDNELYEAASDIKYLVGEDFINNQLNKDSLSTQQASNKFSFLHQKALDRNLDCLYILVKTHDDIVYAAQSDTLDKLKDLPNAGFWLPLKEAGDDSYERTLKAFEESDPIYLESTDMWGSYRSVYLPEISLDGRKYLAGADIAINTLRKLILYRSLKIFFPLLLSMLVIIPVIFAFRKSILYKKRMETYIDYIEKRDKLTGAFSRDYGLQLLSNQIIDFKTTKKIFSICLIDIDNLKLINETKGIKAGDTVLKIVYTLSKAAFRKTDSFTRLEGNKFLVILPDFQHSSSHDIYKEIEKKLDYFNKNNRKGYFIRLSYTMSEYSSGSMKSFLENTRENLKIESSRENWKNKNLQDDILRGIRNFEFVTYFQPKVYLKDKTVSFEALVRWIHPEKGIILPQEFIPIAERSFLINKITKIVLKDSLKIAEILQTEVSVNLSLISFENTHFLNELKRFLNKSPASNFISFELTERVAIDHFEKTLAKIENLKESGVSFSIDDFGSGYSALSYLDKLPINELKIDKSFIDNINTSSVNQVTVEFINKIAKIKMFKVICEGTEKKEQVEKLILLDNYSFQGNYFGKPEPFDKVVRKYKSGEYHSKLINFL